jgi:hypothetical protein
MWCCPWTSQDCTSLCTCWSLCFAHFLQPQTGSRNWELWQWLPLVLNLYMSPLQLEHFTTLYLDSKSQLKTLYTIGENQQIESQSQRQTERNGCWWTPKKTYIYIYIWKQPQRITLTALSMQVFSARNSFSQIPNSTAGNLLVTHWP